MVTLARPQHGYSVYKSFRSCTHPLFFYARMGGWAFNLFLILDYSIHGERQ